MRRTIIGRDNVECNSESISSRIGKYILNFMYTRHCFRKHKKVITKCKSWIGNQIKKHGDMVELANTSASQAEEFGFESRYRHQ